MSDDVQFHSRLNPNTHIAGQRERRPLRRADKFVPPLLDQVIGLVARYPSANGRSDALIERMDRENPDIHEETRQRLIDHLEEAGGLCRRLLAALEAQVPTDATSHQKDEA